MPMVLLVQRWLREGREVRIFTTRVFPITEVFQPGMPEPHVPAEAGERYFQALAAARAIQTWCRKHLGQALPITCVRDYSMIELYDDRAVQVRPNTGELVGQSTRGLV